MYDTLYAILNKSENATLQYSIFYEKVLDEKYLLKLHNVFKTSSKRFAETPPICLFWYLSYMYVSLFCLKFYYLNYAIEHVQKRLHQLRLSEFVILVLHYSTKKKLTYHLKQAMKSISNSSNL